MLPDIDPALAAVYLSSHINQHKADTPTQAARMEKVKRPSISSAGTSEEWGYFVLRWGDYVTATRCQGPDSVLQLLECCDEQLRRDLTRNAGGTLSGRTEEAVLEAIQNLAVREENPMVARVALHNMKQDREESVRAFGVRLRGQASVCRFVKVCTGCGADVNFSEENVADVLCRGLADPEIQQDLLGDANQNRTVEQTLKFVEANEAGKRSVARLATPLNVGAVGSTYKRQKTAMPGEREELCTYCGGKGHGRYAPTRIRRTECPAFGKTCSKCGKDHHTAKVCRSERSERTRADTLSEGAWVSMCNLTSLDSHVRGTLDHHVYHEPSHKWVGRRSKPQPFIRLTVETSREDYQQLGYRPKEDHDGDNG